MEALNGVRQGGILSSMIFTYYINGVIKEIKKMNIGCYLRSEKTSIIAFADDIFLLSASVKGLQMLVNRAAELLTDLCLSINVKKSNYICFKHKKSAENRQILYLLGEPMKKVATIKYLGIMISENLDLEEECNRSVREFLRQFNSMYQKFYFLPKPILNNLFKTYTSSFYGINLWFDEVIKTKDVRKVEVGYHRAIKTVAGMNEWNSNHEACELTGNLIFKHMLSKRMLNFYFSVIGSKCKLITNLRYYFLLESALYNTVKCRFMLIYNVDNIIENDRTTLMSRIYYVQRTEPRSHHVYEP